MEWQRIRLWIGYRLGSRTRAERREEWDRLRWEEERNRRFPGFRTGNYPLTESEVTGYFTEKFTDKFTELFALLASGEHS